MSLILFASNTRLLDVLIVASGFLLRALGGALAIQVFISTWFILCTFMLALFLAVIKRRQELVALKERAGEHRSILEAYSLPFLDQLISVLTASTLVCYALYAMGVGDCDGRGCSGRFPSFYTACSAICISPITLEVEKIRHSSYGEIDHCKYAVCCGLLPRVLGSTVCRRVGIPQKE